MCEKERRCSVWKGTADGEEDCVCVIERERNRDIMYVFISVFECVYSRTRVCLNRRTHKHR